MEEREEMERLGNRYLGWLLGVEKRTLGYLVKKKVQREKLRERAGKEAWEFEKRLEEERRRELARTYWDEMKERSKEGKVESSWEEEKRRLFENRGLKLEELERR